MNYDQLMSSVKVLYNDIDRFYLLMKGELESSIKKEDTKDVEKIIQRITVLEERLYYNIYLISMFNSLEKSIRKFITENSSYQLSSALMRLVDSCKEKIVLCKNINNAFSNAIWSYGRIVQYRMTEIERNE